MYRTTIYNAITLLNVENKDFIMSTTTINARIDVESKEQAQGILAKLGLSMSGAIDMFFKQVVLHNGIPFEVIKIPQKL